jgi:hypothetical protein
MRHRIAQIPKNLGAVLIKGHQPNSGIAEYPAV